MHLIHRQCLTCDRLKKSLLVTDVFTYFVSEQDAAAYQNMTEKRKQDSCLETD